MPHRTPYRPIQMTVPETPSPEVLAAQQAALAKKAAGPGRHVSDTTPSKGRMAKTQRMEDTGSSKCCSCSCSFAILLLLPWHGLCNSQQQPDWFARCAAAGVPL
jgi:hypothetical protein